MRTKTLPVDYASHCTQVEDLREEILAVLAGIAPGPARVPMVSAMTGEYLDGPEAGAGYWYESLRAPVEFDRAVRLLAASGHGVFVEVSPHPVLAAAITETLEDASGPAVPVVTGTLRRDDGGPFRFLASLAEVHVRGVAVDWAAVLAGGRRVDLPTYAFRRQRYWPQPRQALVPAGGDGAGSAAEARFWAAVEGGDLQALADTLDADAGRQPLGEVLPVLAAWRRQERDRSVTGGWRYRVSWLPVADPGSAVLSGTWLVVIPAGLAGGDLPAQCVRAMTASGARVVVTEIAAAADRVRLAAQIGQALASESTLDGVASWLALAGPELAGPELAGPELAEMAAPGYPAVPSGLAGTLALVQALGDAGITAPLWVLTCGAVAATPG